MSWTTPATVVVGQLMTAAFWNAQVQANLSAITPGGIALTTYSPALTSSGTTPTLGTGSTITGRYVQIGQLVFVQAVVTFGTSGVGAGTGVYYVSTPTTMSTAQSTQPFTSTPLGPAQLWQNSTSTIKKSQVGIQSSTAFRLFVDGAGGSAYAVSNAAPWTWAASDSIRLQAQYETA